MSLQVRRESANTFLTFEIQGRKWHWKREEAAQFLHRLLNAIPKVLALPPEERANCYFSVGKGRWVPFDQIVRVLSFPKQLTLGDRIQHEYVVVTHADAPFLTAWISNWRAWIGSMLYWSRKVSHEETGRIQTMGREEFLAEIERMRKQGKKREIEDPYFQTWMVSDYLKQEVWLLKKLKDQVERDLPRIDMQLNGRRILKFEDLCSDLSLDIAIFEQVERKSSTLEREDNALRFMAMLHQGASAAPLLDASLYFDGNAGGLVVFQHTDTPIRNEQGLIPRYPTRISARYCQEVQELVVEQDLKLRDPNGKVDSYPIEGRVALTVGKPAKVSWQFLN